VCQLRSSSKIRHLGFMRKSEGLWETLMNKDPGFSSGFGLYLVSQIWREVFLEDFLH